jgi:hypothetical protein
MHCEPAGRSLVNELEYKLMKYTYFVTIVLNVI